jgi:murein DD-endopeptidase MepM/ murein hydrolase activator NlpD
VFAIDDGVVETPSTLFYRGTDYVAIRHRNGRVVRYCEILRHDSVLRKGSIVVAGQVIGHVGKMFVDSMLHFELYEGTENGPLTQRETNPSNAGRI